MSNTSNTSTPSTRTSSKITIDTPFQTIWESYIQKHLSELLQDLNGMPPFGRFINPTQSAGECASDLGSRIWDELNIDERMIEDKMGARVTKIHLAPSEGYKGSQGTGGSSASEGRTSSAGFKGDDTRAEPSEVTADGEEGKGETDTKASCGVRFYPDSRRASLDLDAKVLLGAGVELQGVVRGVRVDFGTDEARTAGSTAKSRL